MTPPPGPARRVTDLHRPVHPVRFVTAASLFDGHDAAINIMRRLLQSQGAEVVHLGHNRSVDEVVRAVVEEDAQGVAVSSYQGGHTEYFRYLVDRLREEGRPDALVYGGGGGVIVDAEIEALQAYGVRRIFSPADGQRLGLERMVNILVEECDRDLAAGVPPTLASLRTGDRRALARWITFLEAGAVDAATLGRLEQASTRAAVPVLGVTGTGGSGKSSLTDELIRRFRLDQEDKLSIAVLAVDPTRRRGGGALLGDRIRMNAIDAPDVYFRSLATRHSGSELPRHFPHVVAACAAAGFDLVIAETPGIGQGDAAVTEIADVSLYVMTPEYGASSQLEKIDMLELADVVAINKFDRRGADDAFRQVCRQWARDHREEGAGTGPEPVFGTIASRFNDDGTTALYHRLKADLIDAGLAAGEGVLPAATTRTSTRTVAVLPPDRHRYLAEIASTIRAYHASTARLADEARRAQHIESAVSLGTEHGIDVDPLRRLAAEFAAGADPEGPRLLREWTDLRASYLVPDPATSGTAAPATDVVRTSLAGTPVPRVALPRTTDHGDLVRWLRAEHLPGHFPFTAGVFPYRRTEEDPARMFAGEGDAYRTNRRFHLLAEGQPATRLSTAFDSVTLYGRDPDERPDVRGKIGTSGVSIATIDDMTALFDGFDLCDPATSVSMTINGPAPTILAMFLNVAVDQRRSRFEEVHGRPPTDAEAADLRTEVFRTVRGTVQADILKEDQGQNTCLFSTEFSLGVMADMQEWFIAQGVRNFYSVSISGYHIAEAGANPVTQLAFTLANGFTYVESYLARGMDVDDFAPNFSFFFSNGMDPEYTVIGRVARRIWAIAMRERYGANERSQKLKYHVQTSGRSLHAQEMDFNDIRTTLQALCAIYDNANSLHTNAYDEAVTTPTPESVRRALAIQMIITKEWGLALNENPLQGSFVVEELTDLLEEAVLDELDRISERGGVLGAMENGYQRGRIQDDSMLYEHRKHDGSLPIVGVNTFVAPGGGSPPATIELARSTEEEKRAQLARLGDFHQRHALDRGPALDDLRRVALEGGNLFAELMTTVRHASLGEITDALFDVGGCYRRAV